MQLRISVRCAVQTLYIFDVFVECISMGFDNVTANLQSAALGEGRSPFLAFQFAEWWRADEGRDSVRHNRDAVPVA